MRDIVWKSAEAIRKPFAECPPFARPLPKLSKMKMNRPGYVSEWLLEVCSSLPLMSITSKATVAAATAAVADNAVANSAANAAANIAAAASSALPPQTAHSRLPLHFSQPMSLQHQYSQDCCRQSLHRPRVQSEPCGRCLFLPTSPPASRLLSTHKRSSCNYTSSKAASVNAISLVASSDTAAAEPKRYKNAFAGVDDSAIAAIPIEAIAFHSHTCPEGRESGLESTRRHGHPWM
eukprot:4934747-Pleurochrysis_carterae.AAC.4